VTTRAGNLLLALRMLAWRLILRPLKVFVPLSRLVPLVCRPRTRARRPAREARILSFADRLCRGRLASGTCLERSLLAYRFLSEAGADPRLVIAVRRENDSFRWHAWVTRDGQPILERAESLKAYIPVVVFDDQGNIQGTDPAVGSRVGASSSP
jgi:Transglutaminase-like superfamily